ncbi:hypothetical protein KM043_002083 [Ampulex compressa]|nr:hypothetical protein KM043_002083 [Ampulex compressa]
MLPVLISLTALQILAVTAKNEYIVMDCRQTVLNSQYIEANSDSEVCVNSDTNALNFVFRVKEPFSSQAHISIYSLNNGERQQQPFYESHSSVCDLLSNEIAKDICAKMDFNQDNCESRTGDIVLRDYMLNTDNYPDMSSGEYEAEVVICDGPCDDGREILKFVAGLLIE